MAHRVYRLRDTVQYLGGCEEGLEFIKRFETARQIKAYTNRYPHKALGPSEYDTPAQFAHWFLGELIYGYELGLDNGSWSECHRNYRDAIDRAQRKGFRRTESSDAGQGSRYSKPTPEMWAMIEKYWIKYADLHGLYTEE